MANKKLKGSRSDNAKLRKLTAIIRQLSMLMLSIICYNWIEIYFRCERKNQAIFSWSFSKPVIKSLVPASLNSLAKRLIFSLK